ncbi:MAG: gliding motility-associated C-terminal domain-containing protein [Ferruginibacter sp.]
MTHFFRKSTLFLCINLFFLLFNASAQFSPVAVTGFNQDCVAETGTSSLTTTTMALDGVTVSNKVLYTINFRTLNSFGGGGLPDNGTITSGSDSYQLGNYAASNVLLLQRAQSGSISLSTPASFSAIRLLAFSTEGSSLVNAILHFTDGSTTTALTNYTLNDWFSNTTNLVLQGMGRVTRSTPATGADGYPSNPRMYYININLSCTDRVKMLDRIDLGNVTTAGSNAPFPNAVFLAVSGIGNTFSATPVITNATCSAGGSATLNVTGSSAPYSISWNTSPVQTGATATNLAAGNYIATVTSSTGCITTHPVTVGLTNNLTISANSDASICSGGSFTPTITSTATSYSWSPTTGVSNPAIATPVLSPTTTTTYTVTGTLGSCTASASFILTVNPPVSITAHQDTTICLGASFNANTQGNATSYSWSPATGVSNTSIANPVLSPASTTTYTVTGITGSCSASRSFTVTVVPAVFVEAGNNVTIIEGSSTQLQASAGAGTYTWTPGTGLSATNILNPVASPPATTTYTLTVVTAAGCRATDDITITVVPYCVKPMDAITPNGDGINDKWIVTTGACAKTVRAKVYNRYGNLVYESANYQNDWGGTYKGKPVPDGTYYFVLEFLLLDGRKVPVNGNVTILR